MPETLELDSPPVQPGSDDGERATRRLWSASTARSYIRRFGPAVGAYAGCKFVGTASFLMLVHHSHAYKHMPSFTGIHDTASVLASWDGVWYLRIAAHGYHPALVPDVRAVGLEVATLRQNDSPFFPLLPGLARLVHAVVGVGFASAGLFVAVVASLLAAAGIFALGEHLVDRRTGVIAAALWAVAPASGVEWAVYSESLFVALAAWSLYAMLLRRWLVAGALTLVAGLSRPAAVELIGTLVAAAALEVVGRRPGAYRAVAAALIAPVGLVGFVVWIGLRAGRLDAYVYEERHGWLHYFDYGSFMAHAVLRVAEGKAIWSNFPIADEFSLILLVALPCLLLVFLRDRPPPIVALYVASVLFVALTSHQIFANVPRYVLPAFPLLYPIASRLRRVRPETLVPCLAWLALASGWYGAFIIFIQGVP